MDSAFASSFQSRLQTKSVQFPSLKIDRARSVETMTSKGLSMSMPKMSFLRCYCLGQTSLDANSTMECIQTYAMHYTDFSGPALCFKSFLVVCFGDVSRSWPNATWNLCHAKGSLWPDDG